MLALVGHPSSDAVTIKMLYGVDILHLFLLGWLKLNLAFIVRSVETGLGR